ncbi:GDP-L-fucose synthase family protein [Egicoccus halophilus]|uniref:GDP-L-fucose synthase n=1 Tax=Egicoccus halophilus TaxID=1670830 RepID=A0A8J3A9M9_9ACTN|nr:GDP-L-fucose synthase [Egicoccus halophilus]GGI05386.1 GDP-L-fucose synthase [Egicoccus halophilus]
MSQPYDLTGKRVWVAGHRGMVGSALVRRLAREPVADVVTATSAEVDLRRQEPTERFVADERPDVVLLAAAKVGGIEANRTAQAEFLYDNLMIAANVIEAARRVGVERFVVLGSSCVYPREAPQPIAESSLLTGPLEPTNEGYAVAKIAALELAKFYRRQHGMDAISLMPSNLYGPNDNFDPTGSHVLAALLRKVHLAKVTGAPSVPVWGTGTPRREFLHVDDLADATVHALCHHAGEEHLNVGWGDDVTIRAVAELICEVVGYDGELAFDTSMPDGMPRKLLDTSRMQALGWQPRIGLREGLTDAYRWFVDHVAERV